MVKLQIQFVFETLNITNNILTAISIDGTKIYLFLVPSMLMPEHYMLMFSFRFDRKNSIDNRLYLQTLFKY